MTTQYLKEIDVFLLKHLKSFVSNALTLLNCQSAAHLTVYTDIELGKVDMVNNLRILHYSRFDILD
ncbi:MAG: hypothetical protein BWY95_02104 [Bacteroidetes bacterium ADurb.BinA104]|nr:MAG: hypothetical protein BWY95_02104 [Bacteroidetes bacterium ADurb.BinA104]